MDKIEKISCVELFAGVGGMALGATAAKISHLALIERDKRCCETIRYNQTLENSNIKNWNLIEGDVRNIDFRQWKKKAQIVCGGPPCQPFSIGGKGEGAFDERDMFPEAVRAVREIGPIAFAFENVRGLLRSGFANYVEYIRLQLTYPQLSRMPNEAPEEHLRRLEKHHMKGDGPEPIYQVEIHTANAANFGVPQNRDRVFIVGFQKDFHADWSFPAETHSKSALAHAKATGAYYDKHKIPKRLRPAPTEFTATENTQNSQKLPWRTLRDAIAGLGRPDRRGAPPNHNFIDGARVYNGHTGSILDMPAKTVKAGGHGVPGGENMFVDDDGKIRYLTVRESSRVQTFPDDFHFPAMRTVSMRQLGNAVPCDLATIVMRSIRDSIINTQGQIKKPNPKT